MKHKSYLALRIFQVLILGFALVSYAQIDMQQKIASQSGAVSSRNRTAAETHGSGLAVVPADFAQLKLAPGFLLSLSVLDDSDFVGTFRVDEQGDIALPVLGMQHVAGETVSEARFQIRQRLLERKILQDPQVDLSILEYSAPEVTIIGEVASPGKYPLLAPRKLVDVLAVAGGTTITSGNEIKIIHDAADAEPILVHYSKATDPKVVADVMVHPGDTVQVKRAGIVYVLGAVTRPGGYVMQEEGTLNVLQAISLANGTTISASIGTIYLLRRNADGTEVDIALPFNKIQHGRRADVQLHATDVLYVPQSKIKSFFSYSQAVLTSAASSTIYAEVVH
jgi:polysaccharide export outer membrane protein